MKKELVVIFLAVALSMFLVTLSYFAVPNSFVSSHVVKDILLTHTGQPLLESDLPEYLSNTPIVQELPSNSIIQLRTTENVYTITKGSVILGQPKNPEIFIQLPSKYIEMIGTKGFCDALSEASKNKELNVEYSISKLVLTWKYKSLLEYHSCLFG